MKKTLLFPAAAFFLVLVSFLLDAPVYDFICAHRPHWLVQTAKVASRYGDWLCLMLYCLPFLWWAVHNHKDQQQRLIVTMMIVCTIAGISADVIRFTTGRDRPNAGLVPGWYGIKQGSHWLVFDNRYKAFPSGHTAAAMGLIAPLFLLRRRSAWLFLPGAVAIASSRIILGAHHFSDVIAGTLLAFGISAWWLHCGSRRFPSILRPPGE